MLSVTDMENSKETHVHDVNIGSEIVSVEKESVQCEETDNVCDENIAADDDDGAVDMLEDDDEYFEDAVDNLTLDTPGIADEHVIGNRCYDMSAEHENTLTPSLSYLQDVTDIVLDADTEIGATTATSGSDEGVCDSRRSSSSEDEKIIYEKQEAASDPVIVDEEVLREREACLTDEQKQVITDTVWIYVLFCELWYVFIIKKICKC